MKPESLASRLRAGLLYLVVAVAIALGIGAIAFGGVPFAFAEDIDTNPDPDELQLVVEQTALELEEAQERVVEASAAVEANRAQIAELEQRIPGQQERADAALVELYKLQFDSFDMIDFILGARNIDEFLVNYEYVSHVAQANLTEIRALEAMKAELTQAEAELEQAMSDAEAKQAEAAQALAAAQEARAEAQRRAEEEARRKAEQEALARAAAEAAEAQRKAAEENKPAPTAEQSASETAAVVSAAGDAAVELVSDGADWNTDMETFVAEWAPRIDAYLAGSPLAGQGRTFAVAAWTYGVDPRWSPAISNTESSKGAACFLPHNAWGWGSESWDSWEEAIDAHVRGLARGYGYTISLEAAAKYCPPNYQHWYEATLNQMNMI